MGGADHLGQPIGKFALRFLFLALLLIAGILGAVVLIQKGQARIAAQVPPAASTAEVASAQPPIPSTLPPQAAPPEQVASVPATAPADPPAEAATVSQSRQTPPEPAAPAFQIVAKPAIAAAGILETTRGRVTLKDIVVLDPAEMCGQGASAWPCGQLAATQFRRFLRGRSVNCDIPDADWRGEVTARCSLGKVDVATWLVEQGWARAIAGSPYEEVGREAEAEKRGIFGPDARHP